jgi:hypothetical protein
MSKRNDTQTALLITTILTLIALSITSATAISFNEDVCFDKNPFQICFKRVEITWEEKSLLKYQFEEGKVIEIVVAPLTLKDRVYVYLRDDKEYQFDKPWFKLGYRRDRVEPGTYDVRIKVYDKDGNLRLDFDLKNETGYSLQIEGYRKYKTSLTIKNVQTEAGKEVKIRAILTFEYGGVSDATVNFYINGSYIGSAKTDSHGNAELKYTPRDPGTYEIKAVFQGTQIYNASEGYGFLLVKEGIEKPRKTPAVVVTTEPAKERTPTPVTTPQKETQKTKSLEKPQTPGFEMVLSILAIISTLALRKIRKIRK